MKSGKPQLENAIALILPTAYGKRMVFLYRLSLSASPWLIRGNSVRAKIWQNQTGKFEFHRQVFSETLKRFLANWQRKVF